MKKKKFYYKHKPIMILSVDCLHHIIECLDAHDLIVASRISIEWYNIVMLPKFWRLNIKNIFYPEWFTDNGTDTVSIMNHRQINDIHNRKALWKVNEKRYNNNPRHLILDRNNQNLSIHYKWKVNNWSTCNTRISSPTFCIGGVQFQILCYPAGNLNTDVENSGVSMYLMGERVPKVSHEKKIERRRRRRRRREKRRQMNEVKKGNTDASKSSNENISSYETNEPTDSGKKIHLFEVSGIPVYLVYIHIISRSINIESKHKETGRVSSLSLEIQKSKKSIDREKFLSKKVHRIIYTVLETAQNLNY
jgi:hypothetical protein